MLDNSAGPSTASDVYSFGILLCALFSGRPPFAEQLATLSEAEVAHAVSQLDWRPAFPESVPRALRDLAIDCWVRSAHRRPRSKELGQLLCDTLIASMPPATAARASVASLLSAPTVAGGGLGNLAHIRATAPTPKTSLLLPDAANCASGSPKTFFAAAASALAGRRDADPRFSSPTAQAQQESGDASPRHHHRRHVSDSIMNEMSRVTDEEEAARIGAEALRRAAPGAFVAALVTLPPWAVGSSPLRRAATAQRRDENNNNNNSNGGGDGDGNGDGAPGLARDPLQVPSSGGSGGGPEQRRRSGEGALLLHQRSSTGSAVGGGGRQSRQQEPPGGGGALAVPAFFRTLVAVSAVPSAAAVESAFESLYSQSAPGGILRKVDPPAASPGGGVIDSAGGRDRSGGSSSEAPTSAPSSHQPSASRGASVATSFTPLTSAAAGTPGGSPTSLEALLRSGCAAPFSSSTARGGVRAFADWIAADALLPLAAPGFSRHCWASLLRARLHGGGGGEVVVGFAIVVWNATADWFEVLSTEQARIPPIPPLPAALICSAKNLFA